MKHSTRLTWLRLVCVVLLSLPIACRQKESKNAPAVAPPPASAPAESYPALTKQAQEVNDAFRQRDFAHMVDLTYPKVIEAAGGRDKMIAAFTKEMKEMEAEGVFVLSSTAGAATQIISVAGSVYAVIPTTLKVKAHDGIFQTESSMIGISADNGATWTFIDAGGKDRTELRKLLPDAADKLNLPPEKQPVKIANN